MIFDCFFSSFIAFFVGVMMGFHPIIALGGATCSFLGKCAYELSQIEFEDDDA
jgi:hypothetical protein